METLLAGERFDLLRLRLLLRAKCSSSSRRRSARALRLGWIGRRMRGRVAMCSMSRPRRQLALHPRLADNSRPAKLFDGMLHPLIGVRGAWRDLVPGRNRRRAAAESVPLSPDVPRDDPRIGGGNGARPNFRFISCSSPRCAGTIAGRSRREGSRPPRQTPARRHDRHARHRRTGSLASR